MFISVAESIVIFPHRPRRVVEGLLDGHLAQILAGAPAKRTARGGEDQPVHGPRPLPGDELMDR
ncbi:MAG: hypothetical protein WKF40_06135 [Thermoleophilaceae bacterium]